MDKTHEDAAADAYGFESRRLREWAPLIGNGAAIIAVTNVVANAANQDTALDGLFVPLAFGAGRPRNGKKKCDANAPSVAPPIV